MDGADADGSDGHVWKDHVHVSRNEGREGGSRGLRPRLSSMDVHPTHHGTNGVVILTERDASLSFVAHAHARRSTRALPAAHVRRIHVRCSHVRLDIANTRPHGNGYRCEGYPFHRSKRTVVENNRSVRSDPSGWDGSQPRHVVKLCDAWRERRR